MNYVVPVLIVLVLAFALFKKVNVYDSFVLGAKKSFSLSLSVFPYLAAMFITVNALQASGLEKYLTEFFALSLIHI